LRGWADFNRRGIAPTTGELWKAVMEEWRPPRPPRALAALVRRRGRSRRHDQARFADPAARLAAPQAGGLDVRPDLLRAIGCHRVHREPVRFRQGRSVLGFRRRSENGQRDDRCSQQEGDGQSGGRSDHLARLTLANPSPSNSGTCIYKRAAGGKFQPLPASSCGTNLISSLFAGYRRSNAGQTNRNRCGLGRTLGGAPVLHPVGALEKASSPCPPAVPAYRTS